MRPEPDARASALAFVMPVEQRDDGIEAGIGAALRPVERRAIRRHVEPRRREQVGAGIAAQAQRARAFDEGRLLQPEHVEHGGGAAAQPFQQRHLGHVADLLRRHDLGRQVANRHQQRKDDVPRQVARRDVVGQAAEQRRRDGVVVQVHQAGQQQRVGQVDAFGVDAGGICQHILDRAIGADQHGVVLPQPALGAPGPAWCQKRRSHVVGPGDGGPRIRRPSGRRRNGAR